MHFRSYHISLVISKLGNTIPDSNLAAGRIHHSKSPWSPPLVCTPKTSGGIRITIIYKKINSITNILTIYIPLVDKGVDSLGGDLAWSISYLLSGFSQITMDPRSIDLMFSEHPLPFASGLAWRKAHQGRLLCSS